MNRSRLDPFSDLNSLRSEILQLFDESLGARPHQTENAGRIWRPLVDVFEDPEQVTVKVDLPGVNRDSIDVQLTGEQLTVRGERLVERQAKVSALHLERPQGTFQRSFTVGVPVQSDKVQASYREGVLTIVLPKAETVKPRKVEIVADEG